MVPKSDHLANPRFDKKPSAHPKVVETLPIYGYEDPDDEECMIR